MGIELDIFNLILYSFTIILCIITSVAVVSLKLYHGNLRLLLINVSFTHFFALLLAMVTEICHVANISFKALRMINNLTVLCIWAVAFNMIFMLFERIIASKLDKRYETMCIGLPWLGVILVSTDWSIAAVFAVLDYGDYVESLTLAIIALTMIIISLVCFSFMPSLTYKRYMYAIHQPQDFSLSQRYQMSENYRSAKLLTKVVWCFGITSIVGGGLFVLSRIGSKAKIFQTLYPYGFVAQGILYPLLVMYYETKVRDFIFCHRAKRGFVAKTILGKNLVVSSVEDQREAYFQSYRQAWS